MAIVKTVVAACMATLILSAPAYAARPSVQDRKDALRYARAYWADHGRYASDVGCDRVAIRATSLARGVMGYQPPEWCVIELSTREDWSAGGARDTWWNVCATVIHEYGHLVGRRHNRNPDSIMARFAEDSYKASWYPWFPACRYDGDDPDGDGYPDW